MRAEECNFGKMKTERDATRESVQNLLRHWNFWRPSGRFNGLRNPAFCFASCDYTETPLHCLFRVISYQFGQDWPSTSDSAWSGQIQADQVHQFRGLDASS
jgi:hypothetical protein